MSADGAKRPDREAGAEDTGYETVIYYSYNSFRGEGTVILASYDGGLTYTNERVAHKDDACHAGIAGPVAVGPDGQATIAGLSGSFTYPTTPGAFQPARNPASCTALLRHL